MLFGPRSRFLMKPFDVGVELFMLVPIVFLVMPVVVLFALYPGLVSLDLLVP